MPDSSNIQVLNAAGEYEPFSEEKIRSSLQRAEVVGEFQDKVVNRLREKLYEGIPTREIYKEVTRLLKRLKPPFASRYHLKQSIMQLGPTGYPFEKYFAGVLRFYGYDTQVNQVIGGKCVTHEVDVIAEKGGERAMIECKFHNQPGTRTDIKDALYTYARFLDLEKEGFNQPWLVTNTKVTVEVIAYGECMGLKIISWNYPQDFSLRFLVESKDLFPLTVLDSLSSSEKQGLLEQGIVFCQDLLEKEIEGLSPELVRKVRREILGVIGSE